MKKLTLPSIKCTKFTSKLTHKVQDLSLEQGVIDFDLRKQKPFGPTQRYTTNGSVKTYDNLHCEKSATKVNKDDIA